MMSYIAPNRWMRLLAGLFLLLTGLSARSQSLKNLPHKYPSLLWEISGNELKSPSYLFGTMHVSDKMVFRLPDSFYLALKHVQVVSLETDPGRWQEEQKKYEDRPSNYFPNPRREESSMPSGQLTISSFRIDDFSEQLQSLMEYHSMAMNQYLYRTNARRSDYEEDTYLDLHIYQVGRKLGKTVVGLENFARSMDLVQEAYMDQAMAKEAENSERVRFNDDGSMSLDDAYRNGNLDLLDTLNILSSSSKAFSEKFIYKRNEIQANSIDSILRSGSSVFAGVGAAHLPGTRGVIEMLRAKGYKLRPIMMTDRNNNYRESFSRIRVPVSFNAFRSEDGSFSLQAPGKLYESFLDDGVQVQEFADMSNGSYYTALRLPTYAYFQGVGASEVWHKIDSMLYEHTPGKIISRKWLNSNGQKCLEVYNRTRRGDVQASRYYVTPTQILMFRVSGTGEYINQGKEAIQFFNSINLPGEVTHWSSWSPSMGGFQVDMPGTPVTLEEGKIWAFADTVQGNSYLVQVKSSLNLEFLESDSTDLYLMHESFLSSKSIDTVLSEKMLKVGGYPAMDVRYRTRNKKIISARYLISGNSYYAVMASGNRLDASMERFLNSFKPAPHRFEPLAMHVDSQMYYRAMTGKEIRPELTPEFRRYADFINAKQRGSVIYQSDMVTIPYTWESVFITRRLPSIYNGDTMVKDPEPLMGSLDLEDSTYWISDKQERQLTDGTRISEYLVRRAHSSRAFRVKTLSRGGNEYMLAARVDTLDRGGAFIQQFFNSFALTDHLPLRNLDKSGTAAFLADLASRDSAVHVNAIEHIRSHEIHDADFPAFRKVIDTLSWKENAYINHKLTLIRHLRDLKGHEVSDYLEQLYKSANDTVEIQQAVLFTLVAQRTGYSYDKFAAIMLNDPPAFVKNNNDDDDDYDGSVMAHLTDSLELAKSIFPKLLPLLNVKYYDEQMLGFMEELSDSSALDGNVYKAYVPQLLADARMEWKIQAISEKSKGIRKATAPDNNAGNSNYWLGTRRYSSDESFDVMKYVKLLSPWYLANADVHRLLDQMLSSTNNDLLMELVRERVSFQYEVPDSVIRRLAQSDDHKMALYNALLGQNGYQVNWEDSLQWAIAELKSNTEALDSVVFLGKRLLYPGVNETMVYFFKTREKDGQEWKIAAQVLGDIPVPISEYARIGIFSSEALAELEDFDPEKPLDPTLSRLTRRVRLQYTASGDGFFESGSNRYGRLVSSRF